MFSIKKITLVVSGWLLLAIFSVVVIHASVSYRVGTGQTIRVDEQGVCQEIMNSGSQNLFIPTNTLNEWLLFRQNKPSYISLSECTTNLVYNVHTDIQCIATGGNVVDDGAGNKMCKFTASSCLSGWAQYNNWSSTNQTSVNYVNEVALGTSCGTGDRSNPTQVCRLSTSLCESGNHTWGDIARESRFCPGSQVQVRNWGAAHYSFCVVTADCTGATNATVNATITQIGCY